jgi:hypothetical protein
MTAMTMNARHSLQRTFDLLTATVLTALKPVMNEAKKKGKRLSLQIVYVDHASCQAISFSLFGIIICFDC